MLPCKEFEELIPAFALDAVDERCRARIEAHVARCPVCAELVACYRPVVAALPYALPQVEPPADLKYRVLAAMLPQAKPVPARESLISSLQSQFVSFFRAPAFAAAMFALVVALVVWNVSLQNQIAQQAAFNQQMQSDFGRQRALVSTIAYAETQPKHLQATDAAPQAIGRLFAAPELNALALIVYDMPALEPQRVYQIWLIDPAGERTSGGTFTVDERGRAWVYIRSPQPLSNYQGIGITVEPEGGSPKPTGPKMMGTNL
ncbi:MAG: anti-sigma factor [Chloroflexota bacterium]